MDWSSLPREKARCALCGADNPKLLRVTRGWPVAKCLSCGLVYLRERPSEDSLASMYSKDYYNRTEVGYGGYVESYFKYRGIFDKLFEARARSLERFRGQGSILEIGCAHGFLLDHLKKDGWLVSGVEVSPLAAGYARNTLGLQVHHGTLRDARFETGAFDVVMMLDVLEHLHRPHDTLREVSRLLKPGGVLLVQCPWELTHWEEVIEAFLRGRKTGCIEPDAVPAHLYFFNPRTLEAMLKASGFTVIARESGNYGAVRRKVKPPPLNVGSPLERVFRVLYFRLGIQRVLYRAARTVGWGNGLIRYATGPEGASSR
jgi:2-polyprenyl-3-methyl-5-hydroxy-6-metoxy-1,4-benzoquinol methylase